MAGRRFEPSCVLTLDEEVNDVADEDTRDDRHGKLCGKGEDMSGGERKGGERKRRRDWRYKMARMGLHSLIVPHTFDRLLTSHSLPPRLPTGGCGGRDAGHG